MAPVIRLACIAFAVAKAEIIFQGTGASVSLSTHDDGHSLACSAGLSASEFTCSTRGEALCAEVAALKSQAGSDSRFLALQVAPDRVGAAAGIADPFTDTSDIDDGASAASVLHATGGGFINAELSIAPTQLSDFDLSFGSGSFSSGVLTLHTSGNGCATLKEFPLSGDFSVTITPQHANGLHNQLGVSTNVGSSVASGSGTIADAQLYVHNGQAFFQASPGAHTSARSLTYAFGTALTFSRVGSTVTISKDGVEKLSHDVGSAPTMYAFARQFDNAGNHAFSFSGSASSTGDFDVQSKAFAAAASPSTASVGVQLVAHDAITINTDVVADVSRDGGATFTRASLSLVSSLGAHGTSYYEDSGVDLRSQPAGVQMKYRVSRRNGKAVELHGVALYWA